MTLSQEQRDTSRIDGRGIAVAAIAVLLLITMGTALVRLLALRARTSTQATLSSAHQAPPLSSPDAARLLIEYETQQAARLNSYGWEDSGHSYAHIPIARAMQLLVQHPELATPATPQALPSVGKPAPIDVPRTPDRPSPLAPPPTATPLPGPP